MGIPSLTSTSQIPYLLLESCITSYPSKICSNSPGTGSDERQTFGMIRSLTGVPGIFTRIPKTPASQPLQNRSSTPHSFSDQCGSRELGHLLRQVADAPLPSDVQIRRSPPKHQIQR